MSVLSSLNREVEIIRLEIKDHFSFYKKWYIIFGVLLCVGFIAGAIIVFSMRGNLSLAKVPEKIFVKFVQGELNVGSLFFARLFSVMGLCVMLWLSCLRPYLGLFSVALLIYRSFMLGVTSVILIILFNVSGFINVLLIIVPCYISSLCLLAVFYVICLNHCRVSKVYGGSVCSREFWCGNKKIFAVIGCLVLVCILLEVILLPLLSSSLIVVKP